MDTDPTRSLTYAEMAAVMGITLASAKNLTRRKRWARTRSNGSTISLRARARAAGKALAPTLMKAPLMAAERLLASSPT